MSATRQVLYWLAYVVAVSAIDLAVVQLDPAVDFYWRDVLHTVAAARAAPIVIWCVLVPARPIAKIVVVVAAALVWTAQYQVALSWFAYDLSELLIDDLATAIATLVVAPIVRRLAGTIRPDGDNLASFPRRPQFSIRDLFLLTAVVAVLIAAITAMFESVRDQFLGGLGIVILLWVAGTGAIFGVVSAWSMFSTRRGRTRGVVWLAIWLAATVVEYWLWSSRGQPWPDVVVFAALHLGQSALTAAALAPWWLSGYTLRLPERE